MSSHWRSLEQVEDGVAQHEAEIETETQHEVETPPDLVPLTQVEDGVAPHNGS